MRAADVKRQINEYLAMEWGLYDESDPPDEKWPFELEYAGRVGDTDYYRFDEFGKAYYASWSPTLMCFHPAETIDSGDIGKALGKAKEK